MGRYRDETKNSGVLVMGDDLVAVDATDRTAYDH